MNRLQQKCVIASVGMHLLLLLVLLVGPALAPKSPPPQDLPIIDFVAFKTVDAMVTGGGNANGHLPAPPPPPPPPVQQRTPPAPETKPDPEPTKVTPPEQVEHDPSPEPSLIPSSKKTKKPEVSTKLVTRKNTRRNTQSDDTSAQEEREAKAYARRQQRLAEAFGNAASHLDHGVAGGTAISVDDLKGPGGGGLPYANFLQAVKSVYTREWVVPDGITDDEASVDATVTIARDGHVVTWRIVRASGSVGVDASVRRTLERVKYAAPLPDDAKQDERTVPITFSVKAKRALG